MINGNNNTVKIGKLWTTLGEMISNRSRRIILEEMNELERRMGRGMNCDYDNDQRDIVNEGRLYDL